MLMGGGGGMPMFSIAFTQITTTECSISDDRANVVYNQ